MPKAARVGETSGHGGIITGPGEPTVKIGGKPAAVVGDMHICPLPKHPPGPVAQGSSSVNIGGRPAVRMGDTCGCGAAIAAGAVNVNIGG